MIRCETIRGGTASIGVEAFMDTRSTKDTSSATDTRSTKDTRSVTRIVPAIRTIEGGGFVVRRPFPVQELDHYDPFLLLDELGPVEVGPGEAKGAPDHPHRGFETVSYILAASSPPATCSG
jgi:hypothetical protein